jgi:hypothetical protein
MKSLIKLCFLITLFAISFGCKKPVSNETKKPVKAQLDLSATNPYDAVGVAHNSGLAYFQAHANWSSNTTARSGMFSINRTFINNNTSFDTTYYYSIYHNATVQAMIGGDTGAVSTYLTNNSMNNVKGYFRLILAACYGATSLSGLQSQLQSIQDAANADVSLSSTELEAVLIQLDVTCRSANYWADQIALGSSSPWLTGISPNPDPGVINGWKLAAQDGAGALVGGLVGFIFGGPAGFLAGAVSGGLGGTTGELISELMP